MKVSPTAQLFQFLSLILYLWVSPFCNHGSSSWIVLYSLLNSPSSCLSLQTDKLPTFPFPPDVFKAAFSSSPSAGWLFQASQARRHGSQLQRRPHQGGKAKNAAWERQLEKPAKEELDGNLARQRLLLLTATFTWTFHNPFRSDPT